MENSTNISDIFYEYISKNIQDILHEKFKTCFDVTQKHIVQKYNLDNNFYITSDHLCCVDKIPKIYENENWFSYKISSLVLSQKYILAYGLYLEILYDETTITIIYDPELSFRNFENNMTQDILNEYIQIYILFSNINFIHHCHNYHLAKPKISISIDGIIYNRPDREYYIVFEKAKYYTVQLYKIDSDKKREKMILGVWIDADKKKISDPYFID